MIAAAQELGNKSKALALVTLLITLMGEVKTPFADQQQQQQQQQQQEQQNEDIIVQLAPHIVAPLPEIWAAAGGGGGGGGGGGSRAEEGEGGEVMLDLRSGVMGVLIALLPRVGPRVAQVFFFCRVC